MSRHLSIRALGVKCSVRARPEKCLPVGDEGARPDPARPGADRRHRHGPRVEAGETPGARCRVSRPCPSGKGRDSRARPSSPVVVPRHSPPSPPPSSPAVVPRRRRRTLRRAGRRRRRSLSLSFSRPASIRASHPPGPPPASRRRRRCRWAGGPPTRPAPTRPPAGCERIRECFPASVHCL